jgi:iron complex outermembrane receptor protein
VYPAEFLSFFLGFTYLDTEPSDLPYAPEITFSAGMNWRFLKGFKLSLDCQYVDEMYVDAQARRKGDENTVTVDSYFLVNGKLSYAFVLEPAGLNLEVFLAGENLTDTDYEYLPGYPMPGATGMLGVSFEF